MSAAFVRQGADLSSVVAGSLVTALAVIYGCSRVTKWHKTDVRDTRHLVRPCCSVSVQRSLTHARALHMSLLLPC